MTSDLAKDLLANFREYVAAAEDDFAKARYNAAVSSWFKALAILCDYELYKKIRLLPKNHTERFHILSREYPKAYSLLSPVFSKYRDSYNARLNRQDALEMKENAQKLKNIFSVEE